MKKDAMHIYATLQPIFEELLASKFPELESVRKWNQIMWLKEGDLIVSLVYLSKTAKFCFLTPLQFHLTSYSDGELQPIHKIWRLQMQTQWTGRK